MQPPGRIRDAVVGFLARTGGEAGLAEIEAGVVGQLGSVGSTSVRSYINLNTPQLFERTGRGRYRLVKAGLDPEPCDLEPAAIIGKARLYHGDAFTWMRDQSDCSLHAIVTDPPYGLLEYNGDEQQKLRDRKGGGVWRVPPSFDGNQRAPLPRFTILSQGDLDVLHEFFLTFGSLAARVIAPGGNVVVASNPLLQHVVASAMVQGGLEIRGTLVRRVMTMRGGDRPKNAHEEFDGVSVMPRSMYEPWLVFRRRLDGRVQDNLRRWKTGGFRRISADRPFGDVIESRPTQTAERRLAPHPSLKPQDFLRRLVRGVLPLGEGVVLDPFAGSGSTLAAANAVGYRSIGVERDETYLKLAIEAVPELTRFRTAS